MLAIPQKISAHLAGSILDLEAIGGSFPGDRLGDGIPSARFRAKVPGMGVHTDLPRGHPLSAPVFRD
ncbi:MAG: hypothetical protein O2909_11525 [Chloroflexi bacterium]|nr:hypothetical protein [Chloroflexota bacterium]